MASTPNPACKAFCRLGHWRSDVCLSKGRGPETVVHDFVADIPADRSAAIAWLDQTAPLLSSLQREFYGHNQTAWRVDPGIWFAEAGTAPTPIPVSPLAVMIWWRKSRSAAMNCRGCMTAMPANYPAGCAGSDVFVFGDLGVSNADKIGLRASVFFEAHAAVNAQRFYLGRRLYYVPDGTGQGASSVPQVLFAIIESHALVTYRNFTII